jgi:hypothetical protein
MGCFLFDDHALLGPLFSFIQLALDSLSHESDRLHTRVLLKRFHGPR